MTCCLALLVGMTVAQHVLAERNRVYLNQHSGDKANNYEYRQIVEETITQLSNELVAMLGDADPDELERIKGLTVQQLTLVDAAGRPRNLSISDAERVWKQRPDSLQLMWGQVYHTGNVAKSFAFLGTLRGEYGRSLVNLSFVLKPENIQELWSELLFLTTYTLATDARARHKDALARRYLKRALIYATDLEKSTDRAEDMRLLVEAAKRMDMQWAAEH